MDYLNDDIKTTMDKLRQHYPNDNTFKSYTNILSVISSHFKELHHFNPPLTKIGKLVNEKVRERREENEVDGGFSPSRMPTSIQFSIKVFIENCLDKGDEGKIMCIQPDEIYKNSEFLKSVKDRIIYALYKLFPAR